MNARQAKVKTEDAINRKIRDNISFVAGEGKYSVTVHSSTDKILKALKEEGYKIVIFNTEIEISWDK